MHRSLRRRARGDLRWEESHGPKGVGGQIERDVSERYLGGEEMGDRLVWRQDWWIGGSEEG